MARMEQWVLVIVGCLVSMLANPLILAADDHFVAKAPTFRAAETTIAARLNEPEGDSLEGATAATGVETAVAGVGNGVWTGSGVLNGANAGMGTALGSGVVAAPEVRAVPNYRVTVNLASAADYIAVSAAPSYSDIYRFGTLIFAHNTANLFGSLAGLGVGETIQLTEGGVAQNYRVAAVSYYDKTEQGLNGDPWMINELAAGALGHDAALMTCAGVMYGNGDASQRLVVFVDAV